MEARDIKETGTPLRIGAVAYLNARPLTFCLAEKVAGAEVILDLPSRLAEGLSCGDLDVALVPLIEHFRQPGSTILSDACIACKGAVKSVKLFGRTAADRIRTLALDEGSRTSAALSRILLKERFGLEPEIEPLRVGASLDDCSADAVLLIGDRGILPPKGKFEFIWDLGEQWMEWTGLPFVFAMWVARPGLSVAGLDVGQAPSEREIRQIGNLSHIGCLDAAFAAARDAGVCRFEEISRLESPVVGISPEECLSYLRDHLCYRLGRRERCGLETFGRLAERHGLAPAGARLVFSHRIPA